MITLKSLFIALFALTLVSISGEARAQSRPTATITIANSTDATLRIEFRAEFHARDFAEVLVPPLTEKRVTVPAGIVALYATATKANPAKGFSDSLTLNNGSVFFYNITPQRFGTDYLTDRPIDPLPGPVANSGEGDNYLGCFADQGDPTGTEGRDLNGAISNSDNMTTEQCISKCASGGFQYAATQYGKYCFCGNGYGRSGESSNCTMRCAGNPEQTCGGSWANSVYSTN